MRKTEYWKYTYEDALDLIARLPEVAALVYSRTYKDGTIPAHDKV
jgi:citrate synthase